MIPVVDPRVLAAQLPELWSPRVIGEVDEVYVKVARVHGDFPWHHHEHEDELFLVLEGRLTIELEDGVLELGPGEMTIVPKGIRHRPVAGEECRILLVERKETRHSGDVVSDQTRSIEEQLRPLSGV